MKFIQIKQIEKSIIDKFTNANVQEKNKTFSKAAMTVTTGNAPSRKLSFKDMVCTYPRDPNTSIYASNVGRSYKSIIHTTIPPTL